MTATQKNLLVLLIAQLDQLVAHARHHKARRILRRFVRARRMAVRHQVQG